MTDNCPARSSHDERCIDLGYAIAYYRKRKGLTQGDLAQRIGISRQHMGAIEAPHMVRSISMELLFSLADELEIEPYLLLKFSPEK